MMLGSRKFNGEDDGDDDDDDDIYDDDADNDGDDDMMMGIIAFDFYGHHILI